MRKNVEYLKSQKAHYQNIYPQATEKGKKVLRFQVAKLDRLISELQPANKSSN